MSNSTIQKQQTTAVTPERVEQAPYFTPLVDIIETNDEFIFQADLPGVKAQDLDISYDNGVLTLHGKVDPRQYGARQGGDGQGRAYLWQEYEVGHFYRQFTLNTPVKADAIKAELRNGELTLHLPKSEEARVRKIQISA